MKAKSLKSGQILRAHVPYFRRPGHNYFDVMILKLIQVALLIHRAGM